MAHSKSSTKSPPVSDKKPRKASPAVPEVIVDFVFDNGLFFISVSNISERPAYNVSVKFSHKIYGLGGAREVSALPLFRNIEFLAPRKDIRTFLDSSDSYFARKQPTKITLQVSHRDAEGNAYRVSISHDLEIYRDLALAGRPRDVVLSDTVPDEGE